MRRRCGFYLVLACAWLLGELPADARTRYALIFAPGQYQFLAEAPFHARGANLLQARLQKAGVPEENIQALIGAEATADQFRNLVEEASYRLEKNDTLIVLLCSYGFQVADEGYVATANTPLELGSLAEQADVEAIKLSELLKDMAVATGTQQILIVDGFGPSDEEQAESTARFGRAPMTPLAGQLIVLNHGGRLAIREDQEMTIFMWSLLDGLDSHADTNRDGRITALELTKYMSVFAEDARISAPRLAGKISAEMQVFEVNSANQTQFADGFNRQATQLLTEAKRALFLELDAKSAINLLDRARRLCRDESLQSILNEHLLSARALNQGAEEVLQASPPAENYWTLVVNKRLQVFEPKSSNISADLEAGTVVRVAGRKQDWLYIVSAVRPRAASGTLTFDTVPIKPGFARITDFAPPDRRLIPSDYLKKQLALSRQSDERISTNQAEDHLK